MIISKKKQLNLLTIKGTTRVTICNLRLPGTPTEGRGGEVGGEAGGHLRVELGLEPISVGHDGFSILLLLLHVDVHVAHRHPVTQLRHPVILVRPRLPVQGETHWLLRGLRQ